MSIATGKYHIWTVGCQMNQADSQRVSGILDSLGWEEVPNMDAANLVVLNTCSVREQPEKRAHGQLSLLGHAKKRRQDLLVAMMGCMIGNQRTIDDLKKRYPTVDLFFKVESADILPRFLEERWTPIAGEGCVDFADLGAPRTIGVSERLPMLPMAALPVTPLRRNGEYLPDDGDADTPDGAVGALPAAPADSDGVGAHRVRPAVSDIKSPMQITPRPAARDLHYPTAEATGMRMRGPAAFLPVVLGCNKVCSYCIVPSRRGVERSRPMDELLEEARDLVTLGARELTLLGQTVEAYGLDLPANGDLGDLMERLSEIDDLKRIRFMTSYPRHMTDKMIQQMASLPKVCEHVNIPVQHGDDNVLQRMRRGYTLAEYRALIGRLRAWWPGVSLSTDVIVGFCGETAEEFQHTLDLLEEIRFDVVHVAAYSPRPGTLSYKWEDDVPLEVKKQRLHAVEAVQEHIAREQNEPYQGRVEEVLIETHQVAGGQHQWRGRTRTNKLVFFPATKPSATSQAPRNEHAGSDIGVAVLSSSTSTRGETRVATRADVRPGDLVPVQIEKTTPWSLQGRLLSR
ncbi:MAG TPA: MiaB/RimO family radical SAM methylthiotransferase [Ktedonobacterales bacterium]|nr:MiaB/RimO family radical SAM methylthiotransferase [Ktedonobacterales bacterium]